MDELVFPFDDLNVTNALRLLAEFAEHGEADAEYLSALSVDIGTSVLGATIIIYAPDPQMQKRRRNKRQDGRYLQIFTQLYERIVKRPPRGRMPLPNGTRKINGVLLGELFLLDSKTTEQQAEVAREWMIVASGVSPESANEILLALRERATAVRLTALDDEKTFLFHVLHDDVRFSRFASAAVAGIFEGSHVLVALESGNDRIFVPESIRPSVQRVRYFTRLLQRAAGLFSERTLAITIDDETDAPNLLAAVTPLDEQRYALWYLVGVRFEAAAAIAPTPIDLATLYVYDFGDSRSQLAHLQESLHETGQAGYRLQLRKGRYEAYDQVAFDKMQRQIAELDYRLNYLTSIRGDRPKLLRFSAAQLPAFADALRATRGQFLRDGSLKYGFQATELEPRGIHFVWVAPHVTYEALDPLVWWQDAASRPMEFWLDPLWTRHYGDGRNKSMLFVPKHHALHPSIHSWDIENMDGYLRQVVGRWFHGNATVAAIPAAPIYIIDGDVGQPSRLEITILDQSAFVPIEQKFDFLNDNLTLLEWRDDNIAPRDHVEAIPADIRRASGSVQVRRLADWAADQADLSVSAYEQVRDETAARLAMHTRDLTTGLTAEVNAIIDESGALMAQASELNARLASLKALYNELLETTDEATTLALEIDQESGERLDTRITQLRGKVETAVEKANRARMQMAAAINDSVSSIETTRTQLEARLDDLKWQNQRTSNGRPPRHLPPETETEIETEIEIEETVQTTVVVEDADE